MLCEAPDHDHVSPSPDCAQATRALIAEIALDMNEGAKVSTILRDLYL
jgi:hypothetical protein